MLCTGVIYSQGRRQMAAKYHETRRRNTIRFRNTKQHELYGLHPRRHGVGNFSVHVPYDPFNAQGTVISSGYSDQWSTLDMTASLFRLVPERVWSHLFTLGTRAQLSSPTLSLTYLPPSRRCSRKSLGIPEAHHGLSVNQHRTVEILLLDADYLLPPNTYWGRDCNALRNH